MPERDATLNECARERQSVALIAGKAGPSIPGSRCHCHGSVPVVRAYSAGPQRRFGRAPWQGALKCHFEAMGWLHRLGGSLALDFFVTHRLPTKEQIPLLTASGSLPGGAVMGMQVRGALLDGIIHSHIALQPLVQISRLRNVDRDPGPIFGLTSIDVVSGQGLERSVQRVNLVGILLSGLTGPVDRGRRHTLRLPVATK